MRFFLAISTALMISFTGCDFNPNPKTNCLRLPINTDPPTLDPRRAADTTSCDILLMFYEGLTRMGHNHEVKPGLAETIDISEDKLTYTFKLRPCLWTDGSKVTAYDFEETWKQILAPSFPYNNAYLLFVIKNAKQAKEGEVPLDQVGVKALDEKTLKVELCHPAPYFLEMVSQPNFMAYPRRIAHINASHKRPVVCNGPYKLVQYRFGNYLRLQRNDDYWDREAVNIDEIMIHVIPDHATSLNLYVQGDINWAGLPLNDLPNDAIPVLSHRPDFHSGSTLGVYYYLFNTQEFPFNNAKIRQALSLAINRDDIVNHVSQKGQKPAFSLSPPPFSSSASDISYEETLKQAQELFRQGLDELHMKPEDFPKVALSYNRSSGHHLIAQAIQQHWKKALGIRCGLSNKEWKAYLDELNGREFMIARMGVMASYSDPIVFLESFSPLKGYGNYSGWHNTAFTEKINQAKIERDPALRLQYLREAETLLMEEMPVAPIFYYSLNYLKDPTLKNVYISRLGSIDFKWAYFDRSSEL